MAVFDPCKPATTEDEIKGAPVLLSQSQGLLGVSQFKVDCTRLYNAVHVEVYVTGGSSAVTLTVEGSYAEGGIYQTLPDGQATQTITDKTSFDVVVGSAWAQTRLGVVPAGQVYTIWVTPYQSPGQTTVTANVIVASLSAIQVDTGALNLSDWLTIGLAGGIYQGTGTAASPTTGLKVWNSGGIGLIGGYNGGVAQWYADTDGRLYAGGGSVIISSDGLAVGSITNQRTFDFGPYGQILLGQTQLRLGCGDPGMTVPASITLNADTGSGSSIDIGADRVSSASDILPRTATRVVAASNAGSWWTRRADYVCDGTADDVQVAAAIASLPAVGGRVILSEGTFNFTTHVSLTSYVTLEGQGEATTIYLVSGSNSDMIQVNSGTSATIYSGTRIKNLTLDGNDAGQGNGTYYGIFAQYTDRLLVEGCFLKNTTGSGVSINRSSGARVLNNDFRDVAHNTVTGGRNCIEVYNYVTSEDTSVGFSIRGNHIRGEWKDIAIAFIGNGCSGALIEHNYIDGGTVEGYGIQVEISGSASWDSKNVLILGNIVRHVKQIGIISGGGDASDPRPYNISIAHNQVYDVGGAGIAACGQDNLTIDDNLVYHYGLDSTIATGGASGIMIFGWPNGSYVATAGHVAFVSATKKITDSDGGLAIFKTGDTINCAGTASNPGPFTVKTGSVAGEIVVVEALVNETPAGAVTTYAWRRDMSISHNKIIADPTSTVANGRSGIRIRPSTGQTLQGVLVHGNILRGRGANSAEAALDLISPGTEIKDDIVTDNNAHGWANTSDTGTVHADNIGIP